MIQHDRSNGGRIFLQLNIELRIFSKRDGCIKSHKTHIRYLNLVLALGQFIKNIDAVLVGQNKSIIKMYMGKLQRHFLLICNLTCKTQVLTRDRVWKKNK